MKRCSMLVSLAVWVHGLVVFFPLWLSYDIHSASRVGILMVGCSGVALSWFINGVPTSAPQERMLLACLLDKATTTHVRRETGGLEFAAGCHRFCKRTRERHRDLSVRWLISYG